MAQDKDNMVYIVDSVEVQEMGKITPDNIAIINIVKGKKLEEKYGERAAGGVMYIETKPFARKRYNRLFSSLSEDFAKALAKNGSDSGFLYVLDGKEIDSTNVNMLAALEKGGIESIVVKDRRKKVEVDIKSKAN
jgi:hypothetical protein